MTITGPSARYRFAATASLAVLTPTLVAPAISIERRQAASEVPKAISVLAAENLDWVVKEFLPDAYAGATVDYKNRTVYLYTSPSYERLGGEATSQKLLSELESRLDGMFVDQAGNSVGRDRSDTFALQILAGPLSATELDLVVKGVFGHTEKAPSGAMPDSLVDWSAKASGRAQTADPDPRTGIVTVQMTHASSEDVALAQQAFGNQVRIEDVGESTLIVASQAYDAPAHWGSAGIVRGGEACSSGFTVADKSGNRRITTAGHCLSGTFTSRGGGYSFGSTVSLMKPPEYSHDFQILGGSTYNSRIYYSNGATTSEGWQNSTVSHVVKGTTGATSGGVMVDGAHYGSFPYVINGSGISDSYGNTDLIRAVRYSPGLSGCNGPGDSGSAVTATDGSGQTVVAGSFNAISYYYDSTYSQYLCTAYYFPVATVDYFLQVNVVTG